MENGCGHFCAREKYLLVIIWVDIAKWRQTHSMMKLFCMFGTGVVTCRTRIRCGFVCIEWLLGQTVVVGLDVVQVVSV